MYPPRNFFLGGNTCHGFYSLFHNIIRQDEAKRIFVIKGGPGVGKSTFMKHIGKIFLEKGYHIEYHWCSSDNDSLDGLVIEDLKVCLLDGTSPHIVDPKTPGAVDEIINLGEHWIEANLVNDRNNIANITKKVTKCFQTAYSSLRQAKLYQEEWENYITESTNLAQINQISNFILDKTFTGSKPSYSNYYQPRELFASAITPKGIVNEWPSILNKCERMFILKGEPGTGKSFIIERVIQQAQLLGIYVEAYPCSFNPQVYDGVYIPVIKTAVIHDFQEAFTNKNTSAEVITYDLNDTLNINKLKTHENELVYTKEHFKKSINRAVEYIAEAKRLHDELEEYYVPSMKFEQINAVRDITIKRILALS